MAFMSADKVFSALSSSARRQILAYLSDARLSAGQIAERFDMSKPSLSKHLNILENAGLVHREKQGQYVYYSLAADNLSSVLFGYVQKVCPVSRPLKRESAALAKAAKTTQPDE